MLNRGQINMTELNWRQVAVTAMARDAGSQFGRYGMRDVAGMIIWLLDRVPISGAASYGNEYTFLYRECGRYMLYDNVRGNDHHHSEVRILPKVFDEVCLCPNEKNTNVEMWYRIADAWFELDIRRTGRQCTHAVFANMKTDQIRPEDWNLHGRVVMCSDGRCPKWHSCGYYIIE